MRDRSKDHSASMPTPRGLTVSEEAAWKQLAASVTPLRPLRSPAPDPPPSSIAPPPRPPSHERVTPAPVGKQSVPPPRTRTPPVPRPKPAPAVDKPDGLDSHWERRLANGKLAPDLVLDLHDYSLAQAHRRLDDGLAQARWLGARLVLVITGRPRPASGADRSSSRGAIRAEILDWLASGTHASAIAAIRPAARRHGADGALYLVLRRPR